MGFFSYKCSVSKASIPAFPYARFEESFSKVVMVLPDNSRIFGTYDGYGCISGTDIYEAVAPFLPEYDGTGRDFVFNTKKLWTSPDGKATMMLDQFMWSEVLPSIGKSMNELKAEGWTCVTNYDRAEALIKIVRADYFNGQSFEDLKPSKNDSTQGIFYNDGWNPKPLKPTTEKSRSAKKSSKVSKSLGTEKSPSPKKFNLKAV